ncbi:MAG: hypothetical protein AAF437_04150 [Pseudomonadota bacterium]
MLRAIAFALALFGTASVPAFAAGLSATQSVELVNVSVDANGRETRTFAPATDVEPGEQVRYQLTYTNDGSAPAEKVSLIMPVPTEVTFLEGSIETGTSAVSYSSDAGETFAPRDQVLVRDGDSVRIANADEITHIKWVFSQPIAPSESGTISYMAVLN